MSKYAGGTMNLSVLSGLVFCNENDEYDKFSNAFYNTGKMLQAMEYTKSDKVLHFEGFKRVDDVDQGCFITLHTQPKKSAMAAFAGAIAGELASEIQDLDSMVDAVTEGDLGGAMEEVVSVTATDDIFVDDGTDLSALEPEIDEDGIDVNAGIAAGLEAGLKMGDEEKKALGTVAAATAAVLKPPHMQVSIAKGMDPILMIAWIVCHDKLVRGIVKKHK